MDPTPVFPYSRLPLHGCGATEACRSRGYRVLSSLLDRLRRDPGMAFYLPDLAVLSSYLECRPEARGSISRAAGEGRLEIGPAWVEIPQDLLCGEDLVRDLLYGQEFLRRVAGLRGRTAMPVPGGGGMPQYPAVASACGVTGVLGIPSDGAQPGPARWAGLDGTTLPGLVPPGEDRSSRPGGQGADRADGPLLWGGDLRIPAEGSPTPIRDLPGARGGAPVLGTPGAWIDRADWEGTPIARGGVAPSWPVLECLVPGVASRYRAAVQGLLVAERLAAMAHSWADAAYPADRIRAAWLRALEAIGPAYEGAGEDEDLEARSADLDAVRRDAGEVVRFAAGAVTERVIPNDASGAIPIVVFNPSSWRRTEFVQVPVCLFDPGEEGGFGFLPYRLVDAEGGRIPFQDLALSRVRATEVTLAFVAANLPPLGYAAYFLLPEPRDPASILRIHPPGAAATDATEPAFAVRDARSTVSEAYRGIRTGRIFSTDAHDLEVDEVTGRVSIRDRRWGEADPAGIRILGVEESLAGGPSPFQPTGRIFELAVTRIDLIESGEVRAALEIEGRLLDSRARLRFHLYGGLDRIDLEAWVRWRTEAPVRVQVEIDTGLRHPAIRHGVPFGTDAPAGGAGIASATPLIVHGWIAADGEGRGMVVASDRKAFEASGGVLRCDLLRSIPSPEAHDHRMAWRRYPGRVAARFSLRTYEGDFRVARAWLDGEGLLMPPVARVGYDPVGPKSLPVQNSLCRAGEDGRLVLSALKRAEDGDGIVLRAFDPSGGGWSGPLPAPERSEDFRETDMLEETLRPADPERLEFRPFQIRTFRAR